MDCCSDSNENICSRCGRIKDENIIQLGEYKTNDSSTKDIDILAELDKFKLTDDVKIAVTKLYQKAVNGKTRRNAPRRATIYCSLIAVCKEKKIIFDRDEFQRLLDIKNRDINKAAKSVKEIIKDIDITITIEDILRCLVKKSDMKESCLSILMDTYQRCNKTSKVFNSSKMETLAAGLVYNFLLNNFPNFNQESYFKNSKISKDTIINVHENIKQCLSN